MDERFESLLQNLLSEVLDLFKASDIITSDEFLSSYALSSHFACGVIEKVLYVSGFDKDLSDYLKVKNAAAYEDYVNVLSVMSGVFSMSDAGSTSAQSVS